MKIELKYCPSTLQPGFETYSPLACKDLFGARYRRISHILDFSPPGKDTAMTQGYNEKRKTISISGVQEKYSLQQQRNRLVLTGNKGTHILKPLPSERLKLVDDMPANEHLTMQIARQVYDINTAPCGMIFFNDGTPAYITRRFDYKANGTKFQLEDFATLLGKTPEMEGDDYKYNASYLDIAMLIKRYTAAAPVELTRFFRLLVFNFLTGNGDAHLKNFALIESAQGDYVLSPAYDLMCTRLHIDDAVMALHDGLFKGDQTDPSYLNYGRYTRKCFIRFAELAGINPDNAIKIIEEIQKGVFPALQMVGRSFLSAEGKKQYAEVLEDRFQLLRLK